MKNKKRKNGIDIATTRKKHVKIDDDVNLENSAKRPTMSKENSTGTTSST